MSSSSVPAVQEEKASFAEEKANVEKHGLIVEDDAAAHNRAEVVENENGQVDAVISPGSGKKVALESPTPLSDMEKKQKRAERFGVGLNFSEEEKRKLRASRFNSTKGVAKATGIAINSEAEKKAARAARFGTNTSASEDAKKKARADRFSGIDSSAEAEKRKARAERFGTGNNESLKTKRMKTDTAVAAAAQS